MQPTGELAEQVMLTGTLKSVSVAAPPWLCV